MSEIFLHLQKVHVLVHDLLLSNNNICTFYLKKLLLILSNDIINEAAFRYYSKNFKINYVYF